MLKNYFVGIDVGGTKIFAGLVTGQGEVVVSKKFPTPPKADVHDIVSLISKAMKALTDEAGVSLKSVAGVGVAIPGIVDDSGKVIATPNLCLGNVDLKKILEKILKITVAIGNDVNLGVLGERWLGAGRKAKNIVGIFPGTGVGGGVIIKDTFLTGAQGAAAELGHMMVDPKGPKCTCGNVGCLEAVAGRWAIERDIKAALKRGERSMITTLIEGKNFQIKSSALAKALKAKDPVVTKIVNNAAEALGAACVSLNHIFNPDMFLFGGGVVEACGEYMLPKIEAALKRDPFFNKLRTPKVVQSKLGDDAVMLGAVAMLLTDFGQANGKKISYYPAVELSGNTVRVKGKDLKANSFVRADGKVKESKNALPFSLGPAELAELCKKGPDFLVIALSKGRRVVVSAKGLAYLKKKSIELSILPLPAAVKAFNAAEERKAFLLF